MTELLKVELISPEKNFFSNDVKEVSIPAVDGYITVMANYVPTILQLASGFVDFHDSSLQNYFISGGFAHIRNDSVFILSEIFIEKESLTYDLLDKYIEDEHEILNKLKLDSNKDMEKWNRHEISLNRLISLRDYGL